MLSISYIFLLVIYSMKFKQIALDAKLLMKLFCESWTNLFTRRDVSILEHFIDFCYVFEAIIV